VLAEGFLRRRNRRTGKGPAMLLFLGCLLAAPPAQPAAPALFDFEDDAAITGWTASAPAAALSITRDPQAIRHGKGALLCSYTAAPGAPLSLARTDLDVAGAASVSLSLKASSQLPLVLRLAEQDGSVYQLFVTCLPEVWCDGAVPLTDAQLEDGSADENDLLDADQLTGFTIQSLANMPGELADLFGTQTGPQTLVVDNLVFSNEALPSRSQAEAGKVLIDGFDEMALYLLPVGGAELSRVPGHAGAAPSAVGIRFAFAPAGARAWPGIVVPVGHLNLATAKSLRLRMKSLGPLRFHVLVEEQDGSRYETRAELPTGGEWLAKDLRLSDFELDPTRQDENGILDPGQLRVVVIVADCFNALLDDTAHSQFAVDDILFLGQ